MMAQKEVQKRGRPVGQSNIANERSNELRRIKDEHDGLLTPHDVVEAARNKNSSLHSWFDWNDGLAAEKWRLWQARQLITLQITRIENEPVRTYIHVKTVDREGYRAITEVMVKPKLRKAAIEEAEQEFRTFEQKYKRLSELAPIFETAHQIFTTN